MASAFTAPRSLLALPIDLEVILCNFLARNESVMLFCRDGDALLSFLQLKEGNKIILHELCSDRSTNQRREFGRADCDILFVLEH